jgi:hypothetical protein
MVARFRAHFGPPESVVVVWGDWGVKNRNNTNGKFREAVPGIELR